MQEGGAIRVCGLTKFNAREYFSLLKTSQPNNPFSIGFSFKNPSISNVGALACKYSRCARSALALAVAKCPLKGQMSDTVIPKLFDGSPAGAHLVQVSIPSERPCK